jgi:hypothetical protein
VREAVKEPSAGFLDFKDCQVRPVVTGDVKLLKYTPVRHPKAMLKFCIVEPAVL